MGSGCDGANMKRERVGGMFVLAASKNVSAHSGESVSIDNISYSLIMLCIYI